MNAVGRGGRGGVGQEISVCGLQGQFATKLQMQGQVLGVRLGQEVCKSGGIGSVVRAKGFVGGQSRIICSPTGASTKSQCVGVAQYYAVSGGRGSRVFAVNEANITVVQGQIKTGP